LILGVVSEGPSEVDGPPLIPDWPPGAPIQLRPRTGESRIIQAQAERQARQYLGIEVASLHMRRAYLTDSDFPFFRQPNRPIWLAEATGVTIPPRDSPNLPERLRKSVVLPRLYVALDADTGLCVEAFTLPTRPWWIDLAKVLGEAHESFYREIGIAFEPPVAKPTLSMQSALQEAMVRPDIAGQITVRYVLYSDYQSGRGVARIDRSDTVPTVFHRPVWVVMQEGVALHTVRPPAMDGGRIVAKAELMEYMGRTRCVIDAVSGEILAQGSYG
jgi:hypothetical protein